MKKCCRQIMKETLESTIFSIKASRLETVQEVIAGLEYAVKLLEDKEKEND